MIITKDQKIVAATLNEKFKSGVICTEEVDCACGGKDFSLVNEVDRLGILNTVVMCKVCSLIQANPRMTYEEIRRFYSSDLYRRMQDTESFLVKAEERLSKGTGREIRTALDSYLNQGEIKTILEVGAGGGWNSVHFENNDVEWTGVDMSAELVEFGQRKGFNLLKGSFDEIKAFNTKFDIVILNHVIEHFTNLYIDLIKAKNLMADDGVMYIGVPNIKNYGIGQFQLAHNYYFTPTTFKAHMAAVGLNLIRFGEAETIHMHGLFQKTNKVPINNHKNEYEEMRNFIDKYNSREKLKSLFRDTGILPVAKKVRDALLFRSKQRVK